MTDVSSPPDSANPANLATAAAADAAPREGPAPPAPLEHGNTSAEWKAVHEELKANDTTWQCLAFDGIQHDGRGGLIEYRRCPGCQSTLGRPIAAAEAFSLCQHQAALHGRSAEAVLSAIRLTSGRS